MEYVPVLPGRTFFLLVRNNSYFVLVKIFGPREDGSRSGMESMERGRNVYPKYLFKQSGMCCEVASPLDLHYSGIICLPRLASWTGWKKGHPNLIPFCNLRVMSPKSELPTTSVLFIDG